MSRELDAKVVYGFAIDANIPSGSLSQEFIDIMELDGNPYYNSPDREFDLYGAIGCLINKSHTMLDRDCLDAVGDEQIIVYVRSTMVTATNEVRPLGELKVADFEQKNIDIIAGLFSKTPGWIVYPTYI